MLLSVFSQRLSPDSPYRPDSAILPGDLFLFQIFHKLVRCILCITGLVFGNQTYADTAANQAALDLATTWIVTQQNPDGSWGADHGTRFSTTATVVDALKASNQYNAAYYAGIAWLEGREAGNVDYLARRIQAVEYRANTQLDQLALLAASPASRSGWGLSFLYESSALDTAIALNALLASGDAVGQTSATDYLLATQNADGGWSLNNSTNSGYWVTAQVLAALEQLSAPDTVVSAAINNAAAYLTTISPTDTTLALTHAILALYRNQGLTPAVDTLVTEVLSRQTANGDWGDSYTTATAMRALAALLGTDVDSYNIRADITDQTLRSVINAQLGKNAYDNLTQGEILKLTTLDLRAYSILNLTGLGNAANLTEVQVNADTDTSAIAGLGIAIIVDSDSDNIADAADNCPFNANPGQANLDGDALGDVCDNDIDGDAIANTVDPDNDNDGMPDSFESLYGLAPLNPADASSNIDGDTDVALAEFHAGTSPIDINSNSDNTLYVHYKIFANDGEAYDSYGASVAIDGNRAFIGAPHEATQGFDAGAVYFYTNDGFGNWRQQAKLIADDVTLGSQFGSSIAISGSKVLIGARGRSSAYIFADDGAGVWIKEAKLVALDPNPNAYFGDSVALDGDTAIIGAPQDSQNGALSGAAYIFTNNGAGIWSQVAKLSPQVSSPLDGFGASVALSGTLALIGAPQGSDGATALQPGAAYIFTKNGSGAWEQQARLAGEAIADDRFGNSVALSGDTALVGAPGINGNLASTAFVFTYLGSGAWSQPVKLVNSDASPGDPADKVSLVGSIALLSSTTADSGRGAAYVFTNNGAGAWSEHTKLAARDRELADGFGAGLSVSNTAVILGASLEDDAGVDSGSAYIYELDYDEDGVLNKLDNCIKGYNVAQLDIDNDGYGNRCDADFNNDGAVNSLDIGMFRFLFTTKDPIADINEDGVVNVLDIGIFRTLLFKPPGPSGTL